MDKEEKEAYKEVLIILKYMEKQYQEKIPKYLIDFFEKNCSKEYKFDIDFNIPLKQHKLKKSTLSILALLNINYWCETEEEKNKLINKYIENEKIYQEELRKKYDVNNLFNNTKQEERKQNINIEKNVCSSTKQKESIFEKLMKKLKNI